VILDGWVEDVLCSEVVVVMKVFGIIFFLRFCVL